jgi:hypothetical protein
MNTNQPLLNLFRGSRIEDATHRLLPADRTDSRLFARIRGLTSRSAVPPILQKRDNLETLLR